MYIHPLTCADRCGLLCPAPLIIVVHMTVMASLLYCSLLLLTVLSLTLLFSRQETFPQSELMKRYEDSHSVLGVLIETQRNRTLQRLVEVKLRKRDKKERAKKDMIVAEIDRAEKREKVKKKVDNVKKKGEMNKYEKRNDQIKDLFKKRLEKVAEYCTKYKKHHKTKIHGAKPFAALKSFSLGRFLMIEYCSNQLLLEPGSKLMTCRTAKHGSTSWTNNLVQIYRR